MPRCLYKSMQTHNGDVQRERDELLGKQTNKQTKTDNATVKKEHTTASQLEGQKRKSFFFSPAGHCVRKKNSGHRKVPKVEQQRLRVVNAILVCSPGLRHPFVILTIC